MDDIPEIQLELDSYKEKVCYYFEVMSNDTGESQIWEEHFSHWLHIWDELTQCSQLTESNKNNTGLEILASIAPDSGRMVSG